MKEFFYELGLTNFMCSTRGTIRTMQGFFVLSFAIHLIPFQTFQGGRKGKLKKVVFHTCTKASETFSFTKLHLHNYNCTSIYGIRENLSVPKLSTITSPALSLLSVRSLHFMKEYTRVTSENIDFYIAHDLDDLDEERLLGFSIFGFCPPVCIMSTCAVSDSATSPLITSTCPSAPSWGYLR